MPKVYLLATVVALVTAGLVLTGCPKPPTVVEINPQFEATPVRGVMPLTVSFNDITNDEKAAIKAWRWDFGDGAKGSGPSPVHEYKVSGVFPVKLTITTSSGEYVALKEGLINVLRAGDFESPDPETNSISSEGVTITVPAEISDSVTFGITRELTPMAPDAYEEIILMSETYTISNNLSSPETICLRFSGTSRSNDHIHAASGQAARSGIGCFSIVLIGENGGWSAQSPSPEKYKITGLLLLFCDCRQKHDMRWPCVQKPCLKTPALWKRCIRNGWMRMITGADYWKLIITATTLEEIAAAYYGDMEDEESFYRRDFTDTELNDSGSVALAVAQAITNILAEADMRVPTLVMETDNEGGTFSQYRHV